VRGRDSLVRRDSEAVIGDGLSLERRGGTFWWGLQHEVGFRWMGVLSRKVFEGGSGFSDFLEKFSVGKPMDVKDVKVVNDTR
jgi:hypothetical protein